MAMTVKELHNFVGRTKAEKKLRTTGLQNEIRNLLSHIPAGVDTPEEIEVDKLIETGRKEAYIESDRRRMVASQHAPKRIFENRAKGGHFFADPSAYRL